MKPFTTLHLVLFFILFLLFRSGGGVFAQRGRTTAALLRPRTDWKAVAASKERQLLYAKKLADLRRLELLDLDRQMMRDAIPQITFSSLKQYIAENGEFVGSLFEDKLNSDWLKKIDFYVLYGEWYVSADMILKDGGTKDYIFCFIPQEKIDRFASDANNNRASYGTLFHMYFFNNKCKCKED